jgi:hypothetical protein
MRKMVAVIVALAMCTSISQVSIAKADTTTSTTPVGSTATNTGTTNTTTDDKTAKDTLDSLKKNAISLKLNAVQEGEITADAAKNVYKVDLPIRGKITIDLTTYMNYTKVSLVDSDGKVVVADDWVTRKNGQETGNWQSQKDLEAGTYYLQVSQQETNKNTGKYTIKVSNEIIYTDDVEPNNTIETAQQLNLTGKAIDGYLSWNDDVDFYKVELPAQGRINLQTVLYMSSGRIILKSKDGVVIDSFDSETDANTSDTDSKKTWSTAQDLEAGTYYIEVRKHEKYNNTGKYSVTLSYNMVNSDDVEPNNTFENAQKIELNAAKETQGYLTWKDDKDVYKITLDDPGKASLNLTTYAKCIKAYLTDEKGNIIDSNELIKIDNGADSATWKSEKDLEKGIYYVVIAKQEKYNYTGQYFINVSYKKVVTDGVKDNDTIEKAQTIGINVTPLNGYISVSNDKDVYKLQMPVDDNAKITIGSYMKYLKASVLDEKGQVIVYNDLITKDDKDTVSNWIWNVKLQKGTYYIKVEKQQDYGFTGKYTVKVESEKAAAAMKQEVETKVSKALETKNFATFQDAYNTTMEYYSGNESLRDTYLSKISGLYNEVRTPDVVQMIDALDAMVKDRSLPIYDNISSVLDKNTDLGKFKAIQNEGNRIYFTNELINWGHSYIWTDAVVKAVNAVNAVWTEKTQSSKDKAYDLIELVESQATRTYLVEQVYGIPVDIQK